MYRNDKKPTQNISKYTMTVLLLAITSLIIAGCNKDVNYKTTISITNNTDSSISKGFYFNISDYNYSLRLTGSPFLSGVVGNGGVTQKIIVEWTAEESVIGNNKKGDSFTAKIEVRERDGRFVGQGTLKVYADGQSNVEIVITGSDASGYSLRSFNVGKS